MAALVFDNVGKSYEHVTALDGLTLEVADGEPISVIGPSGCGKSTMLLLAAGMMRPDGALGGGATSGGVEVDGRPVDGPRLKTALILQEYGLLPWKTVYHNAALGLEIRGVPRDVCRQQAMRSLVQVGLGEFADAYPGQLSGGMRQRLGVARALALDADLMLMDEPLSALDALTREDLQDLLLELWRRRKHTMMLVTHSIEEAVYLGRRVVVLTPRPGRVAAIVDNPEMGQDGYRQSEAFYKRCAELRAILAEEGAVGRLTAEVMQP